jgi:hypothetical protein
MAQEHPTTETSRYQTLLDRGLSPEKAQRILNLESDGDTTSEPETYADWTDEELYVRAGELGVEDRAGMGRDELIAALRAI